MSVERDEPEKPRKTTLIYGSVMVIRERRTGPKKGIEPIELSTPPSDEEKSFIEGLPEPETPSSE